MVGLLLDPGTDVTTTTTKMRLLKTDTLRLRASFAFLSEEEEEEEEVGPIVFLLAHCSLMHSARSVTLFVLCSATVQRKSVFLLFFFFFNRGR